MPDDDMLETEAEMTKEAVKKLKDSAGDTSGLFTPSIEESDIPK